MPPQSPPDNKGRYKPLTSSPLNPLNPFHDVKDDPATFPPPPQYQNAAPPRPRFKVPRAASPRKWLLRQKAAAAMRAAELRRGFFPENPTSGRPGRLESSPGSGLELGRFDH